MKVYQFRGTVSAKRDSVAMRDALALALEFAGSEEDDGQAAEASIGEDENGKWFVTQDNRAQNPTDSETVAGPFDTEAEAQKACSEINAENAPQLSEIEVDLPECSTIEDSTCERMRSGSYRATVLVKFDGNVYEGIGYCGSHFVRGSVEAEYGAMNEALADAVAEVKAGPVLEDVDSSEESGLPVEGETYADYKARTGFDGSFADFCLLESENQQVVNA